MKILLTGAAGNLGSAVCAKLHREGFEVVATDRSMTRDLPVRLIVADLTDRISCYGLMEGAEAIVHLAAHPNDSQPVKQTLFGDNVSITMNLIHAAYESGINKFIFSSSVQAMSKQRSPSDRDAVHKSALKYLPADGEMPPNPGNIYGLSKQICEEILRFYAREKGLSCVAIRFPFLFNPEYLKYYRRYRMSWKIYLNQKSNLDECFAALSVNDAARLISASLKADIPGYRCYFPASKIPVADEEISELVKEYYGGVALKKAASEFDSLVDISKITAETGWIPEDDVCRMIKECMTGK